MMGNKELNDLEKAIVCPECNTKNKILKVHQFEREVRSTPYHKKNSSEDYLELRLFECKECKIRWISLIYLPTHRGLKDKLLAKILNKS